MLVAKRVCLECGNTFEPKNKKHLYCCKKCFRKHYWKDIEISTALPSFVCQYCGKTVKLEVNPLTDYIKFTETVCCFCGKKIKEDHL